MNAPTPSTTVPADAEAPSLAVAGQIIDGLAVRDFAALVAALTPDVHFRALLPSRELDLTGREAVRSTFTTWFGDAERFELVEAVVGELGGRLHLRWRLSVTHPRVGPGRLLVEQQLYADADPDGRLREVALLCSGFRPEPA